MEFTKQTRLRGEITVPGDKSISHRSVMFGAIASGLTEVTNFLQGADCLSTISCFRQMGITIENTTDKILVRGNGLHGLTSANTTLDVGNSGTTIRLLSGILAGQSFSSTITGDSSIQKRPMDRIIAPLTKMGADIQSIAGNAAYSTCVSGNAAYSACITDNTCSAYSAFAPLEINGRSLTGISYQTPVASAQIKSCLLLAGLYADTPTTVIEPALSRNHTELMLSGFGATLTTSANHTATILPNPALEGIKIDVPGDISSAAYFIVAGLITPHSEILIKNVGVNPTRAGIIKVCQMMNADITLLNMRYAGGEPVADIFVRYTPNLTGCVIEGDMIPTLIDEIPIIAVMAALAQTQTVIRNAEELKVKESNRLEITYNHLTAMGADITATNDGMMIEGNATFHGNTLDSFDDHRIAMAFAVAGINASGITNMMGAECVNISYPNFYQDLQNLY